MKKKKILTGNLINEYGYAIVNVDISFEDYKLDFKNLKGFVDTGASVTCINERLFKDKIDLTKFISKQNSCAGGKFVSIGLPSPEIHIVGLFEKDECVKLISIDVINKDDEFDVIIGNDFLFFCEFKYNGFEKTYSLEWKNT